jgi:hypothetical protein
MCGLQNLTHRRPPDAKLAGGCNPRPYALAQDVPLKLRKHRQQPGYGPAGRGSQIERLREGTAPDPVSVTWIATDQPRRAASVRSASNCRESVCWSWAEMGEAHVKRQSYPSLPGQKRCLWKAIVGRLVSAILLPAELLANNISFLKGRCQPNRSRGENAHADPPPNAIARVT